MAEGGFVNPSFDPDDIDPADWEDNEDEDGQTQDETTPFLPGGSSTPGPPGEEIQMQTMSHEQSWLPQTSYTDETTFGGTKTSAEAWEAAKNLFPNMSSSELDVFYSPKGRLQVKMFGQGKKTYDIFTTKRGTGEQQLNPKLTKEIKNALGKSSFELSGVAEQELAENQKQLKEKQKELEQSVSLAKQQEKLKNDMEKMRNQMKQIDEQRTALEDTHGTLNTEKIEELKRQKNELQKEHQEKRKQLDQLSKTAKNTPKLKEDIQNLTEENARLNETIIELKEKINKEAVNEMKVRIAELERQNEEDRLIIDDEETSPSERDAAEGRVAERQEELDRLTTQIEERERAMPLRERVKEIFKKYGVTVTAIVLAAGVTIGAVISAITNALKSMGKALGNGLKEIGKKTASILPGLIGSIVSFLFKAAGQAIGFLAEHTWLLILAVVAFLVEGQIKKQR